MIELTIEYDRLSDCPLGYGNLHHLMQRGKFAPEKIFMAAVELAKPHNLDIVEWGLKSHYETDGDTNVTVPLTPAPQVPPTQTVMTDLVYILHVKGKP